MPGVRDFRSRENIIARNFNRKTSSASQKTETRTTTYKSPNKCCAKLLSQNQSDVDLRPRHTSQHSRPTLSTRTVDSCASALRRVSNFARNENAQAKIVICIQKYTVQLVLSAVYIDCLFVSVKSRGYQAENAGLENATHQTAGLVNAGKGMYGKPIGVLHT